jgi:hypothetical protein
MLCRDGAYRCAQWDIRSNHERQRIYLVDMDITDHEPIVTGKRVLVGSWGWHIPTNIVTWSHSMFEIYGIPPGETYSLETALQRLYVNDREAVERAIRRASPPLSLTPPITASRTRMATSAGCTQLDASSGARTAIRNGCADSPGTSPSAQGIVSRARPGGV